MGLSRLPYAVIINDLKKTFISDFNLFLDLFILFYVTMPGVARKEGPDVRALASQRL